MSYVKTEWQTGDLITADKINKIEDGIEVLSEGYEELKGDLAEVDDRLTLLDGGTPPKWEIGNVGITTSGWNYDITASTKRIRTPKGKEIFLKAGTKIGLKTYNGYRYYVGIRKTDGSYIVNNDSSTAWQVADLTLTTDGYVVAMISANPETDVTDISTLSELFFIENFDGKKSFVEEVRENIEEIARQDIETTFINAYISDIGIITNHDGYRTSGIVELKCGETLFLKARGERVVSSIYRYNRDGSKRIEPIAKFSQAGIDEFRYTASEKVEYVRFCYMNSFDRDYGIYSVSNNMIDGLVRRNTTANDFYSVMFDKVLCIGDSITQGFYGDAYGFPTGKDYPSFLAKMTGWECTNAGHSGYTTIQYWDGKFLETFDLTSYDAVILFLGTNGGFTDTLASDTASKPYADTNTGDYCKIIEYIKEQNDNIKIFMIVPPVFNELDNYPYGKKVLTEIAEKYDLPLINLSGDECSHFIANRNNGIIHPNNDYVHYGKIGYLQIADNIRSGMVDYIADNPLKFELPY